MIHVLTPSESSLTSSRKVQYQNFDNTSFDTQNTHFAMLESTDSLLDRSIDEILGDLGVLKSQDGSTELVDAYLNGDYKAILSGNVAQALFKQSLGRFQDGTDVDSSRKPWTTEVRDISPAQVLIIGLASFSAFLQANVTGPPLLSRSLLFPSATPVQEILSSRACCLSSLTMEGLSVYQHIPHIELFTLARAIFTSYFPLTSATHSHTLDSRWMRIRINAYHQRLLSSGASNARLSDSAAGLQVQIDADVLALEGAMMGAGTTSRFSTEAKVMFLLEKAQIYIMQGVDGRARNNLVMAKGGGGV